ncbi:hypothetical protein K432DRAFT_286318 [Lepidopterella palustris CBS 459.81]|uniref:PQ-loop-domain-containing protein n=1 Tax=Lepidopterella palustris CBS 459.81 TaxID=1314670 RepID=A0A8E2EKS2_9PEZI|nr:hypothetical protein K432DRAFT_286318 [Lepidopterella palustris CBS 459.81]
MSRFSLLSLIEPSLPASCEPENDFLRHFSATFHTCIPTNLAFISSLLGTLSIVSWLFAQLPQIYKNHQLKSTSGLSIFFLAEWLLGDLSNLLGSIFTRQALWQVIIAGYYCSVDCALVGQWLWYEYLKHGRPLRSAWGRNKDTSDDSDEGRDGMAEVLDGVTGLDVSPQRSNPMDVFRIPNFARSPSSTKEGSSMQNTPTPTDRAIYRIRGNSPMPSPKTILYISLLLALISNTSATPIAPSSPLTPLSGPESSGSPVTEAAGKILSWLSTLLYLGSRLPQLYKNHIRRSTAGLSPTLFAAAFFGNLFYSSSLLTNPCAWNTYPPGSGRGWVEPEGSIRFDWVVRAAPFFLGAAGVLVMDAAVGAQFWYFGDGERGRRKERDGEVVVIVDGVGPDGQRGDNGRGMRWRWRRVSGWMRGWVPSVSVAGTPRVGSPAPSERDAVAEARALLGAGRCERTYGGV